jgi:hypothetical protein
VTVEPPRPGNECGEAHSDVQRNARLLGQHLDRTKASDDAKHRVECGTHGGSLAHEMPLEVAERCAGV